MVIHWYSFRVNILGALAGLVLLAYGIAYYSTSIYYDLAINNQKESTEKLLGFHTSKLLNDLQETQKTFGYKLIKEQRFKQYLQTNNQVKLKEWLDQSFKRYFVTAGLLDLSSLRVKNLSSTLVAASFKNEQISKHGCSSIAKQLDSSVGSERLKPKYALCLLDGYLYSEVMIPIGVLKLKGYLHIVADVSHELKKLEKELKIPIRIMTPTGQNEFRSVNWPVTQSATNLLLTHEIRDETGNVGMIVNGIFDLKNFDVKINNTQKKFMVVTTIVTWAALLLVAYFLQKAYTPLKRLKHSSGLLLEGKYVPVEESRLLYEFIQPVQAFNKMLFGLEAERAKRSQAEDRLKDERDFSNITLNTINNAVIVVGLDELIKYVNSAAESIFMTSEAEMFGHRLNDAISFYEDKAREKKVTDLKQFLAFEETHEANKTLFVFDINKHMKEIEFSCSLMHRHGKAFAYVFIYRDVTEDRELRRQLNFDAYHDRLTGLLNRHAFEQYFETTIEDDFHETQEHIIAYIDLDQFKVVNDICGHAAGDLLLQKLAERFKNIIQETGIVARLGGDEFGLILPHYSLEEAETLAQLIIKEVIDYRFIWNEKVFTIGISIGLSQFGLQNDTLEQQMSAIDTACYIAKKAGGNQYHLYEKNDKDVLAHKGAMDWVSGINKGLSEGRFVLYVQPIKPLSSKETKKHYEILIRYHDEDGSIIQPDAFLSSAERYNLISRIDLFVVNTAIEWLVKNQKTQPDIVFSINLSGRSLGDYKFQAYLEKIIKTSNVDTRALCFEITETVIVADVLRSVEFIKSIKALGVKFSLDDFGSGLSSFAYLKQFPVDYLKIDGMFVKEIMSETENYVFVRSITEVGHCLGMKVIAEFVENKKMYHFLRQAKVDYIQGWAVGKPEPLANLNECRSGDDRV